jgi:hypothetical protein
VAPLGAANAIALVPPTDGASAGADVARCAFATADIETAGNRFLIVEAV